jgi:hypothetical protein
MNIVELKVKKGESSFQKSPLSVQIYFVNLMDFDRLIC